MMTDKAFSEFSISAKVSPVSSAASLTIARANAPPNNSKTIDTVVEVGSPRVLKVSRRITSIAMTARQIHMISWK